MKPKPLPSPAATALRRQAEERLREQHPEAGQARTEADNLRLVHELQVHQIELEMQNEELRQAREQVEAGLEKYSDLYDFAPVGYLTLDREGTIREANLTSTSLLGIDRSRLLQRRLGLFVPAADQPILTAFLARVFASKGKECCEVTLLKAGKPPVAVAVLVRIEATLTASGQECRAVLEDITALKRAEEDRLILNKLESTGILAGGIAHDFNNLLTVVLLNLELAQDQVPPGEEVSRRLEAAKQATLTSRSLTRQLTLFAQGGQPIRKLVALPVIIEESVHLALSGSRVRSAFSQGENLWPVEVDAGLIGQAIRNMVLNAREAMPEGGLVTIRAENEVLGSHETPLLPPGDYVRVSITDDGIGIPKEALTKVFDPYFSTKQRGTQKGMGLGLTISHSIIQKHQGAITVESEPGVGTTIHLHLPASHKALQKDEAPGPGSQPRPGKILVMEDVDTVRNLIGRTLQRMGHTVELAEDGQQAVEVYRSALGLGKPFDLVLLDLTVRGGNGGLETVQALLKTDPAVRAIVMSGYAHDPVLLEPKRHGFKGALVKPFDIVKLRECLVRVMGPGSSNQ